MDKKCASGCDKDLWTAGNLKYSAGAILLAAVLCCQGLTNLCAQTIFESINGFEPHFVMPPNSIMKNIVTDYGAVGDGVSDDTQAFLDWAASGERSLYIPSGTYLVKSQIRPSDGMKRITIMGEKRSTTTIKLAAGSPGYDNPLSPKVFLHTRAPNQQGEQNFNIYLYHLTIEIGENNPGAIGVNFHTNNTGAVKDVAVKATDPVNHKPLRGLQFSDYWFGPGNGRYLEINGFHEGILVGDAQNHTVLEYIHISNCDTGIRNAGNTCSIRNVEISNCKTGVVNSAGGHMVLLETSIQGSGGTDAIINQSHLLARSIETAGFSKAIASSGENGDVTGPDLDHYSSDSVLFNWPTAGRDTSLGLSIVNSPEFQYPASSDEWAVMPASGDITNDIQQAIDDGKKTIFIQGGEISSTIFLRNDVERIMGIGVRMTNFMTGSEPAFKVVDGNSSGVIVELLYSNYGSTSRYVCQLASKRDMVFRHGSGGLSVAPEGYGGRVFCESIVGVPIELINVNAWLRDMNTELGGADAVNILNNNSRVWILGQKTEDYGNKIKTINGGFTELLGGMFRQNWDAADNVYALLDNTPLFLVDNSHASFSFKTGTGSGVNYKIILREIRGEETRDLLHSTYGGLCGSNESLISAYSEAPGNDTLPPAAPSNLRGESLSSIRLKIDWNDESDNEWGFVLERKTGVAGSFEKIASLLNNETSYTDAGLTPETEYIYRVFAFNGNDSSDYSNELSITTPAPVPPEAPGDLAATTVSSSAIDLNWTDNSTIEEGFVLEYSIGTNTSFSLYDSITANQTQYPVRGLNLKTRYYFRLSAFNEDGNSAYSNEAFATTDSVSDIPDDHMIYFPFDELEGSVSHDFSGNNFNGQLNSLDWKPGEGIMNGALQFGGNGYLNMPLNTGMGTAAGALSMWIRTNTDFTDQAHMVYGSRQNTGNGGGLEDEFHVSFDPNENLYCFIEGGDNDLRLTSPDNYTDNSWHHVVFSWQAAGTCVLYVDGKVDTANTATANEFLFSGTFRLGRPAANTRYFTGLMDEVRFYDRQLNSAEVNALYLKIAYKNAPLAPSNLSGTALSEQSAELNWKDLSVNEDGFIIERSLTSGSGFQAIDTVQADSTRFKDETLQASTTYFYRVMAYNDVGNSPFTQEIDLTIPGLAPASPSGLAATFIGLDSIVLVWTDNSSDETGFMVERMIMGVSFEQITTTAENIQTYTDKDLSQATRYVYRVKSFNDFGESEPSDTASFTTLSNTGISKKHSGISIFPNPASGVVTLSCTGASPSGLMLTISDLAGKIILSERIPAGAAEYATDVSSLSKGAYILCVSGMERGMFFRQIMIIE